MTVHEISAFRKFAAQQNDLASTLALNYNKTVHNMQRKFGITPRRSMFGPGRVPSFRPGGSSFNRYVNAITGQESAGNWRAINKTSGALGRYQFMPKTLTGLGFTGTRQQFLSSPQLQTKYMHRFTQQNARQLGFGSDSNKWSRQQYRYIAAAHYGGVGGARKIMRGNSKYGNTVFGGKSPYSYITDIDRRMKWN